MTGYLGDLLHERKIVRTSDLHAIGLDGRRIAAAVEQGLIVKASFGAAGEVQGFYADPMAEMDGDYDECMAMAMTGGILCGQYAAMKHGIATCTPDDMKILIPFQRTLRQRAGIYLVRTRKDNALTVGIEERPTDLGIHVRMTSKARTVIDLIRARNVDGDDFRHGLDALVHFLTEDGTTDDLMAVAVKFESWVPEAVDLACNAHAIGEGRRFGS